MNREHLLQEASRLSRIVADDAMRVIEQRGIIERLRSGANLTELEQAEDTLKAMLKEQSQHEHQLVQIQAKLLF